MSHEACVARRPPRARPPRLRLRRQPHHDRRPDRARLLRPRAAALPGATAGTSSSWVRSPNDLDALERGSARRMAESRPPERSWCCAATSATRRRSTPTPPRRTASRAGRRRGRRGQGDPRPARTSTSVARRRARVLPRRGRTRCRHAREAWEQRASPHSGTGEPALADEFDACLAGAGVDGWESKLPDVEGGRAARDPVRRAPTVVDAVDGRRARPASAVAPTSPATPARSSSDARADRHATTSAAARSTSASASTAWAAIMNGMAASGCCCPFGGTFFVFSDYMRPRGPRRRALRLQGRVRLVARLHRSSARTGRRTSRSSSSRRSGRCPASGHPPRRRERDRAGVARAPRRRRARPRSSSPARSVPVLEGTAERSPDGRRPRRVRPRRRDGAGCGTRPRAHRHRLRGAALRRRAASGSPARGCRCGSCRCRRGSCSRRSPTTYRPTCCRRACPTLAVEAGDHVRVGALRRRHDRHRPLRGVGAGRRRDGASSASPSRTSWPGARLLALDSQARRKRGVP